MKEEQKIQMDLATAFPYLVGKVRIQRVRRVYVNVAAADLAAVLNHLVDHMGFGILCAITGLDLGASLGVTYHLARENGTVLSLETSVPKDNPVIRTVSDRFPAADIYEREMVDLLGIQVQGLPEGARYPLTDDWPAGQFPLRKDWKPTGGETPALQKESNDA